MTIPPRWNAAGWMLLGLAMLGSPGTARSQSALQTAASEVGAFRDVNQFQPGKTAYACGFFAVSVCKAMRPIGTPCTTLPIVMADMECEE